MINPNDFNNIESLPDEFLAEMSNNDMDGNKSIIGYDENGNPIVDILEEKG